MFFENTIAAIRTDLDESCQHVNTNFPDVSLSSWKFDRFYKIATDNLHPIIYEL